MDLTFNVLEKIIPELASGTVTAFIGKPGTGKSTLCMEIIMEKIDKIPVIFFMLDRPVHIVMRNIISRKEKASHMLRIIDGYSCLSGSTRKKFDGIFQIENISNPSDITVTVSSVISQTGERGLFILDSFSTILDYINEDFAIKVLNSIIARLRENEYWGFIVFEDGIHSEQFYNKIRHIMDCIVDFKIEENGTQIKRFFRAFVYRYGKYDTKWHPLNLSKVEII